MSTELGSSAGVLIIDAGIVGRSTAYHRTHKLGLASRSADTGGPHTPGQAGRGFAAEPVKGTFNAGQALPRHREQPIRPRPSGALADEGIRLQIDHTGRRHPAIAAADPALKPETRRIRC